MAGPSSSQPQIDRTVMECSICNYPFSTEAGHDTTPVGGRSEICGHIFCRACDNLLKAKRSTKCPKDNNSLNPERVAAPQHDFMALLTSFLALDQLNTQTTEENIKLKKEIAQILAERQEALKLRAQLERAKQELEDAHRVNAAILQQFADFQVTYSELGAEVHTLRGRAAESSQPTLNDQPQSCDGEIRDQIQKIDDLVQPYEEHFPTASAPANPKLVASAPPMPADYPQASMYPTLPPDTDFESLRRQQQSMRGTHIPTASQVAPAPARLVVGSSQMFEEEAERLAVAAPSQPRTFQANLQTARGNAELLINSLEITMGTFGLDEHQMNELYKHDSKLFNEVMKRIHSNLLAYHTDDFPMPDKCRNDSQAYQAYCQLIRLAANPQACTNSHPLAMAYRAFAAENRLVVMDEQNIRSLYERSSEIAAFEPWIRHRLALSIHRTERTPEGLQRVIQLLNDCAEERFPRAYESLANIYRANPGMGMADMVETYYTLAVEEGIPTSLFELGKIMLGQPGCETEAQELLSRATFYGIRQ